MKHLATRTHLSAHEIAALRLDGLPSSKRGVQKYATAAGWAGIDRPGPGGGKWFAIDDLPGVARADLARRIAANDGGGAGRGRPRGSDFWREHPDVAAAVESILAERSRPAATIMELLAQGGFAALPSPRTLRRYVARLEAERPALFAYLRDPDVFRSKYRVSLGRADAAVTRANQVWEIDTTKADVLCKEGRRSILGIVDVYSRRPKYLVVESESARSARATLIAAITEWGVLPEVLRADQGSGFVNATMKTGLAALGIELDDLPPARPDLKPHVERLFRTFTEQRAAVLDGFIGQNVAQAQTLRAAARRRTGRAVIVPEITAAELQDIINHWVEGSYNQRVHSSTGEAPIKRWMASPAPSRAAPDADALRLALSAHIGHATVTKRGVQWKRGRYWAAPLAAWMDQRVVLRRDEDDLGALFVFAPDGNYICTAVNHERSGLSERDFAMAARRDQADLIKQQIAELRERRGTFRFEDARDQLLRADAAAAGKLATLPPRTVPHATPAIDSMAGDIAPAPIPAHGVPAHAVNAPRRAPATPSASTIRDRVAHADALIADAAAGRPVDPGALQRARQYAQSTEYQAEKILTGGFARQRPAPPEPIQWRTPHDR